MYDHMKTAVETLVRHQPSPIGMGTIGLVMFGFRPGGGVDWAPVETYLSLNTHPSFDETRHAELEQQLRRLLEEHGLWDVKAARRLGVRMYCWVSPAARDCPPVIQLEIDGCEGTQLQITEKSRVLYDILQQKISLDGKWWPGMGLR